MKIFRDKLGESLLSDRIIKVTYQLSGKNIQKFLNNCELVCALYATNKSISEEDVRKLLEKGEK